MKIQIFDTFQDLIFNTILNRNLATKSQSVDQQYFVKDQFLNKIMCFDPVWYDDLVSRAG